ncbi:hypothetical protein V5799_012853 [Amblyomma americanum]|uniref:Uncharacterized protein n=1 Tax=Amblyomma americanum TaxID=6943 RepID=A0AAQ4E7S4_AMBAM
MEDEDWIITQQSQYNASSLAQFYMSYLNIYNSSLDSAPLVARIIQSELTGGYIRATLQGPKSSSESP